MIGALFLRFLEVRVVLMSAHYPHSPDIAFAPVLIGLEENLEWLRSCHDLELGFALDLSDDDSWYGSVSQRADRVRRSAIRDVELPGLTVTPTEDGQGLLVSDGEQAVPIMLGKRLADYVEHGLPAARYLVPAA